MPALAGHTTGRTVFPYPALRSSSAGGLRRNPSKWLTLHHHLVQPTSVMEEVIPPSFLGSPPGTLMLTPKPQLELAPDGPVRFMKCPVAVADPEVGAPPIQDRIQILDHYADLPVGRKRPHYLADPLADMAARLFTWPNQEHPPRCFPELEAQEREAFRQRRQPTLVLVHHHATDELMTRSHDGGLRHVSSRQMNKDNSERSSQKGVADRAEL